MAAPSRTAQFSRLHKILKKYYSPVAPAPNRSLLEHLLFASCLENAHYRIAEESFAALVHTFFDWNEIRVSSVRELSEVVAGLPDPPAAAHRVKRILQSVFEATYSFDLEELHKQNLGPAVERLEKIAGTTKFSIAYVVQSALAGHAIPIDFATLEALHQVDLATDEDVAGGVVPGLDRAIPKNSGVEFGSLLHQLGADFAASPYSPALHAILVEVEPKAKDHLPSRRGAKHAVQATPVSHRGSDDAKGKRIAPETKAPASKPGKPAGETKKEPPEGKKEAGQEKAAAAAKERPLEPKKKTAPSKKKTAAEVPESAPLTPAESPRKKEDEKIEAEPAHSGKKKPSAPPKKAPPKKKPEEGKGKSQVDQGTEASGPDAIAKRKPR